MEYTWDIQKIINSKLNDIQKNIILGEENNNLSVDDTSTISYENMNQFLYKIVYSRTKKDLYDFSPILLNNAFSFYNKIPEHLINDVRFNEYVITPDLLINVLSKFIKDLNDPEITKIFEYIKNPDNHVLKIDYDKEDTKITDFVRGRVLKDVSHDFVIGSYYIKGTLYDIPILTHEIGHMLSGYLFKDQINPLFYNYLRETEAYYLELLMCHYLYDNYNITEHASMFRIGRLSKTAELGFALAIQDELCKQFIRNYNEINRKFKDYNVTLNKSSIKSVLRYNIADISGMINSYLIALYLVKETIKDKEKGLDTYKRLFLDKEEKPDILLNKFGIYDELDNSLNEEINMSEEFMKTVVK